MLGEGKSIASNHAMPLFHTFRFGPFVFDSEIDITELHGLSGEGRLPVSIRIGSVPERLKDAASFGQLCSFSKSEYLLNIPKVARFHVANGDSVHVQLAADAPPEDVSTFLMGSVFGALCHQNGLLPLHASAIEIGGAVTVFLGESGSGKSTLAACLQSRGYRIVSDDICVLEHEEDGMHVVPVAGWLKLWRPTLSHLGKAPEERNRVYSADDKYRIYLANAVAERLKIANLIFLEKSCGPQTSPRLEALATAETIGLMMRLTYLGYITELTGSHARVFRQCASTLDGARSFRFIVPWGFEQMDAVLDMLETDVIRTGKSKLKLTDFDESSPEHVFQ